MNVNSVTISGNVGKDPVLNQTRSGTPVCTVSVCVNSKKKQGEEWIDKPNWVSVVVFGRLAEQVTDRLSKGSHVIIHGRLDQSTWEKDGEKRSTLEVIADTIDFPPRTAPQQDEVLYGEEVPF